VFIGFFILFSEASYFSNDSSVLSLKTLLPASRDPANPSYHSVPFDSCANLSR